MGSDGNGEDALKKVVARIRALLDKTEEHGCTEGEAISAAEKAAEMMAKHGLTEEQVRARAEQADSFRKAKTTYSKDDEILDRIWVVAVAIAKLTNTRYWRADSGTAVVFFGFDGDVEIATYLLAIVKRAMTDETRTYVREILALVVGSRKRRRTGAFMDGMRDRLFDRIWEIAESRRKKGTGIVVLTMALIDAEIDRLGIQLSMGDGGPRSLRGLRDYDAGQEAADKIGLNDGVRGPEATAPVLMLGDGGGRYTE